MPKETETKVENNKPSTTGSSRGWLYGTLAAVIVILVFMAGAGTAHRERVYQRGSAGFYGVGMGGRHQGFMGMVGGNVDVNGQSRATGVVTSVNGSNFTIAGNGSTTQVTTNSSTQYQGGNQVKQNDTVTVFGTTSNGALTATTIIINP